MSTKSFYNMNGYVKPPYDSPNNPNAKVKYFVTYYSASNAEINELSKYIRLYNLGNIVDMGKVKLNKKDNEDILDENGETSYLKITPTNQNMDAFMETTHYLFGNAYELDITEEEV